MLTTDLLRVSSRKGTIAPRLIDPGDVWLTQLARRLITMFEAHMGQSRGELEGSLTQIFVSPQEELIKRGLIKLLEDSSVFEVACPVDPLEVRRVVFTQAARVHPVLNHHDGIEPPWAEDDKEDWDPLEEVSPLPGPVSVWQPTSRSAVLNRAASLLGITPEQVETGLYADLPQAHQLTTFETLEPQALLHRYNLALVQGILLRASLLSITVTCERQARYRQLFRAIKFHRLLYRLEPRGSGWNIVLDGPLSLFKSSQKYGINMANFLPSLLHADSWELSAELLWGANKERRLLSLSSKDGLVPMGVEKGTYRTREEVWFVERFAALKSNPWTLDPHPPLVKLPGGQLVIPDYALRHPDGRVAYLEILGFWRRGSLEKRLQLQREGSRPHLLLAVSSNLQGSVEALGEVPEGILYFRDILPPREVIQLAEQKACIEAGGGILSLEAQ